MNFVFVVPVMPWLLLDEIWNVWVPSFVATEVLGFTKTVLGALTIWILLVVVVVCDVVTVFCCVTTFSGIWTPLEFCMTTYFPSPIWAGKDIEEKTLKNLKFPNLRIPTTP